MLKNSNRLRDNPKEDSIVKLDFLLLLILEIVVFWNDDALRAI